MIDDDDDKMDEWACLSELFPDPDGRLIGQCHHREVPTDGVFKMAPKHVRMLEDQCAKYESLVSYARHTPEELEKWPMSAADLFPEDCDKLGIPGEGTWHHGFNSGMLAALRLALGILVKDQATIEAIEVPEGNVDDSEKEEEENDDDRSITEHDFVEMAFRDFPFLDT